MEKEDLQKLIADTASVVAATLLDNYIRKDGSPYTEGEQDMATRQRLHISLPTGEKVWITGSNYTEAFTHGLEKYGALFAKPEPKPSILFGPYAMDWLTTYKKPKLRQTTYKTYENQLRKHVLPYFEDTPIECITTLDVQKFFNTKSEMSKSSARQMKIILHEIFAGAIEDGHISKDPTESKRLTLPDRQTEREALSTNDYADIIRSLPLLNPKDALLLALLMFTGMRRGEVLGLMWDDVDNEFIHVKRSVTYNGNQPIIGKTKSKAGIRIIPISPQLRPYLEGRKDGYVIGEGDSPITESSFDRTWQRIEKTIDLHGATPHVFRHTFLTQLCSTGVTVKTLQAIAGHADIQTTMNRYVHKVNEDILDAGRQFGNLEFN